jgi:hypothetical protein
MPALVNGDAIDGGEMDGSLDGGDGSGGEDAMALGGDVDLAMPTSLQDRKEHKHKQSTSGSPARQQS